MDSLFDADPVASAPTLSVGELSAQIQRVTARTFPSDLWVSGQIRNLNRSSAGHVYFDLAEPTPAGVTPTVQIPITLLAPEREHVNRQLVREGGRIRMEDGIEVRICGRLRWYSPRGSLQFRMHRIDPAFTLGRLQQDRDRLLRLLADEGLLRANAASATPPVPLRIGLITSRGSAAEADVRHELETSGFAFDILLIDARTQGLGCGPSVVAALDRIARADVDLVLLVRGGGARTDLAGFDGEDIARAIAAMPVPVHTGIGHEVDRSIADEVAHTAHKTPTAAAAAVVTTVRGFLDQLESNWTRLRRSALASTGQAEDRLRRRTERLVRATGRALGRGDTRVDELAGQVRRGADRSLVRAEQRLRDRAELITPSARRGLGRSLDRLELVAARIAVHDPAAALARGWSITTTEDGRTVRDPTKVSPGTVLRTRVAGGEIHSTVDATRSIDTGPETTPAPEARPAGGAVDAETDPPSPGGTL